MDLLNGINQFQANNISASSGIGGADSANPQLALAKLQMELASANKNSALESIKEIEKTQAQKRSLAEAINVARDMVDSGVRGSATQEEYNNMKAEITDYRDRKWAGCGSNQKFCEDHGLEYAPYGDLNHAVNVWNKTLDKIDKMQVVNAACDQTGVKMPTSSDKETNKKQWENLITSLQTAMDSIGADIQTKMVILQDYMGQYNSYMQGANSAVSQANQVLGALAKGQ